MTMRFAHTIVLVADPKRSKAFYSEVVGVDIKQDFGTFVLFSGNLAIHDAKTFRAYIGVEYSGGPLGAHNVDIYFQSDDIQTAYARVEASGTEIIHALAEQPWGEKVFRFYDPDRHVVEIGEITP